MASLCVDGQLRRLPSSPPPSVPSSPKKARVEDVSVGVSKNDSDSGSGSDDEDAQEYGRQLNESDGFDVQDFPNSRLMCMIRPMDDLNDNFFAPQLKQCVDLALTQYNTQQGTKLEFVKYVKANWHMVSGFQYYITFEVKDADADTETKVFQARVWLGITEKKVLICRPRKQ